jgi:hypothetical protein
MYTRSKDNSYSSIDTRCRERRERLRKKDTKVAVRPLLNRDYIPNKYSTIKEFFNSWYCLRISTPTMTDPLGGVYFLTYLGDESKIKIGKGSILDRRVRDYLTSHYRDIKVLCYVFSKENMEATLEKDFHDFFHKNRYDREWYESNDFLLNSIEEIKQINNFMPFVIPRKGPDIYEDPNYFYNKMKP